MDGRLDRALQEIEAECAGIVSSLDADDLDAAGLRNQALHARLDRFGDLLDEPRRLAADGSLQTVAARLCRVLALHDSLARRVSGERDGTADALKALHLGRRAATHYLDTAGN